MESDDLLCWVKSCDERDSLCLWGTPHETWICAGSMRMQMREVGIEVFIKAQYHFLSALEDLDLGLYCAQWELADGDRNRHVNLPACRSVGKEDNQVLEYGESTGEDGVCGKQLQRGGE